jgi:hypothetical protein
MAKLTEKTFATAVTLNSLIHIVNTGDTSQSAYGSSYKASLSQLVPLFGSNPDVTVTGGTYNPSTGIVTFFNNTGGTFNVSGFVTGFTDSYVSGGTYAAGTATFTNTTGGTFTVPGFYTGSSEFYVSDGSLTSNRFVDMNGFGLALSGGSSATLFGLIGTGDKSIQWSQTGVLNWDLINDAVTNDLQIDRYSSGGGYLDTPIFFEFSSGNVGIGNLSPTAKFHINNTTTGATFLAEDSTNPDSTPFIIDASGNTGIGTTNIQSGGTKLHISGNSRVLALEGFNHVYQEFYPQGLSSGRFGYFGYPSVGSTTLRIFNEVSGGTLSFGTSGTSRVTIDISGNIGIGTTTPTQLLDVNGTIRSRVTNGAILIGGSETSISGTPIGDGFRVRYEPDLFGSTRDGLVFEKTDVNGDTPDGGIMFANVGSGGTRVAAMSIRGTGRVGIGITSPTAQLHVNNTGTTNSFLVEDDTNPDTTPFVINNVGNVGIGTTTPSEILDVNGKTKTTTLQITSGATNGYVLTSDASGNATWQASSGGVTIDPYNNVGNTGTSFNWDVSGLSTNYEVTLTANTTLNLTNVRNGEYGTIVITQDGTGGRTLTFGTVNGSATTHRVVNGGAGTPTLTSNANATDILTFTYNGSTMFWTVGNDYT